MYYEAATAADISRLNGIISPLGYKAVNGDARTNTNPLQNAFIRLDFQGLPFNSILTIRDNYAHAEQDVFSRSTSGTTFAMSDNGYTFKSDKSAYVAQLKSSLDNGMYNEVFVGLTHIRDGRATFIPPTSPQLLVRGTSSVSMQLGAERSSQANQLDQDVYEFTENLTIPVGNQHRVTFGTQNQWYKVRNLFGQNKYGYWQFNSLDSLAGTCATCGGNGTASSYQIGVPGQAGTDGAVRFHQQTHALYVQDEWAASNRLTVTAGLRADVSMFPDKPPFNQGVRDTLGRSTAELPSGNWQISPRVGFNWDVTGDGRNQLRAVADGSARRIIKPGQVFSRVHVDDIASAVLAAMSRNLGGIFNVCDDEPCAQYEVVALASKLLGRPAPKLVPWDEAAPKMSEMARSFYAENRRVRNERLKRELGVALRYPSYREGLSAIAAQRKAP